MDEGVIAHIQPCLMHHELAAMAGFAGQINRHSVRRAKTFKSSLQGDNQLFQRYSGEAQQAERLDPGMSLNQAKLAAIAETFKSQHQLIDWLADGGLLRDW